MTGCGCDGAKCRLAAGDERHGSRNGYGNLGCRCVPCRAAARESGARYRAENAEKKRESDARYRAENAEEVRERHARYRAENAEKRREYGARYYAENAEKERERKTRYWATPEGKAVRRAADHRRRDREVKRSCPCVTAASLRAVWALDSGLCAYCGAEGRAIEHVVPLRMKYASTDEIGGWGCVNNFRVVCTSCNSSKWAHPLQEWLDRRAAKGTPIRPGATNSGLPCPAAAARTASRMLPASPGSPD